MNTSLSSVFPFVRLLPRSYYIWSWIFLFIFISAFYFISMCIIFITIHQKATRNITCIIKRSVRSAISRAPRIRPPCAASSRVSRLVIGGLMSRFPAAHYLRIVTFLLIFRPRSLLRRGESACTSIKVPSLPVGSSLFPTPLHILKSISRVTLSHLVRFSNRL